MLFCWPILSPSQIGEERGYTEVEHVEQFTYLGSIISITGGTDEDIKARKRKAQQAFAMLKPVWKSIIKLLYDRNDLLRYAIVFQKFSTVPDGLYCRRLFQNLWNSCRGKATSLEEIAKQTGLLINLMVIDWVSKTAYKEPKGMQWILQTRLEDLDFADDICMLSHRYQDMQHWSLCLLERGIFVIKAAVEMQNNRPFVTNGEHLYVFSW
jgi:hypothetical protein